MTDDTGPTDSTNWTPPDAERGDSVQAVMYHADETVRGTYLPRDDFPAATPPADAAWVDAGDPQGPYMVKAATVQRVETVRPELRAVRDAAQHLADTVRAALATDLTGVPRIQLPVIPRIQLPVIPRIQLPRLFSPEVRLAAEDIHLKINAPDVAVTARTVEVRCGNSYVTIRQVMGRTDEEWTVYEGDSFDQGRNKGLQGKVNHAPTGRSSEEVVPWAADLVTRRERAFLAQAALKKHVDDQPHPVEPDETT